MAKIIDGKAIREFNLDKISEQVEALKEQGILPTLAVIIVGSDPASRIYVNNKKAACERTGMRSLEYALPADTTQEELLALIKTLNEEKSVNGILCQLPLPRHLDETEIINAISPEKDVDAFHPQNVGHIMIGDYDFVPCTPAGIIEMLDHEGISAEGKKCVVIGRSNIVGKPMSMLLLHRNGTVTTCHSRTKELAEICRSADILVAAVGRAKFVTADMVKPGAVVIDVGVNRIPDATKKSGFRLVGDCDFEGMKEKASYITPVPGGVGPMTITMLMWNTVQAAKRKL